MNKDYLTPEEAEEYYQTMRDAKVFQNCLGAMSIVLGLVIIFLLKELFGLFFVVIGLYAITTKEIIMTLPNEWDEE